MSQGNKKVLFVCMGNICRSPTGEGVFADWLRRNGLDHAVEVDSAGTTGYHAGELADARMRAAAAARGFELRSRARQVCSEDFARFDLIVAMDRSNLKDLESYGLARPGQLRLFSEFLDDGWPTDVPDPYYGGADGFEEVLDMICAGCEGLAAALGEVDEGAPSPAGPN